jgi:hypothetical protein
VLNRRIVKFVACGRASSDALEHEQRICKFKATNYQIGAPNESAGTPS